MRASYFVCIAVFQEGYFKVALVDFDSRWAIRRVEFILGLPIPDLAQVRIGWVLRGISEARSVEEGITGESWSVFGLLLGWINRDHFVGSSGLRIIKKGGGVVLIIPKTLPIKNYSFKAFTYVVKRI